MAFILLVLCFLLTSCSLLLMAPNVHSQRTFLTESGIAHITRPRLLLRVDNMMSQQFAATGEALPTVMTDMCSYLKGITFMVNNKLLTQQ
eukprot:m.201991 g.201991  ORF g.201991 m.201991 type:complete len:90 (+) comp15748_c1_seq15:929-1198(+)